MSDADDTSAILAELIGPEERRSAQLAWGLSRFKEDKVLSSSIFATEDAARAAIARGA